jgi:hypothetical protein
VEIVLVVVAAMVAIIYFRRIHPGATPVDSMTNSDADVEVVLKHVEARMTEIELVNNGQRDVVPAGDVTISWTDADLANADALVDYDHADTGPRSMKFLPKDSLRSHPLKPGESRAIGWLRLSEEAPVHAEMSPVELNSPGK